MSFSTDLQETLQVIKVKYYSSPSRRKFLQKGETLMYKGDENRRLYLIISGTMGAFLPQEDGSELELFRTHPDMFVGVFSYFSKTYKSYTTIRALEEVELAYIAPENVHHLSNHEIEFLPIIVYELAERQKLAWRVAQEKEKTLKQLLQADKMATLGQLAAGLAHELNNAVGVLQRHTEWLSEEMKNYISQKEGLAYENAYQQGLSKGQFLDSAEVREQKKILKEEFKLDADDARKLAKIGWSMEEVRHFRKEKNLNFEQLCTAWEFGQAYHDMLIASRHAVHVVKSVKQLGVSDHQPSEGLSINQTINESLALLKSAMKAVRLEINLAELPTIYGSGGEFVQIWLNLMKNAVESMLGGNTPDPVLTVTSSVEKKHIKVVIRDNGPGIPPEIIDKIFQPSFTTKVGGLSFGLGLGLTIVERLVEAQNGKIKVASQPGDTSFSITIPLS